MSVSVFVHRYHTKEPALGSDIGVFLTSPVVRSSRGTGLDRGPQFSVKWEVSSCWKLFQTLTGSDAPRPSGNNENICPGPVICHNLQVNESWRALGCRCTHLNPLSKLVGAGLLPGESAISAARRNKCESCLFVWKCSVMTRSSCHVLLKCVWQHVPEQRWHTLTPHVS